MLWAAAALLLWCLSGGRAALVLLAAAWTLCRADWQLAERYPEVLAGRDLVVTGYVCDFARSDPEALRFVLDRETGEPGAPGAARLHLSWYDEPPDIRPGQRWQLRVRLRPPRGLVNPGAFDFERWLYTRRITATGYVRPSRLNRPLAAQASGCPVGGLRDRLAGRVESALEGHPAAGHVLGVVVGATHRLTEHDWELLRQTGTTHLLAISGLNIAMVALPFVLAGPALGRVLPIMAGRPAAGLGAGLLAAAAYSALAGFAVSTVRALIMLTVVTLLTMGRRRLRGFDVLGVAGLVVLVLDPPSLASASFWLSFVAVAWLMILADDGSRWNPEGSPKVFWRRWIRAGGQLVYVQLVLGFGLAPLSLGWFQQVSLIAPLTNLLAVPVFTLAVMPLALAGTALLFIEPGTGSWLLRLAAEVVQQLMELLRPLGALEMATWRPPATGWQVLVLCAAAAVLTCWWRPVPWRWCAVVVLLPVILGIRQVRPALQVTVLDVGQGLAVLVETPNHTLLYDAGPAMRMRDAGESVVLPVMREAGISSLDLLLVSHDDNDHRGGARSILTAFPGATLISPVRIESAGAEHVPCVAGLAWQWDGVWFRIVSPLQAGDWSSDNDGSCVLRIDAPRASVLLPGDIEQERERLLLARGQLQPVDLMVAPHHGSRTSSGADLVTASQPRFVVFAAGYRNRWGFPAREVQGRWRAAGACLLDTAGSGALVFATSPSGELRLLRQARRAGAHLWTADVPRGPACPGLSGA